MSNEYNLWLIHNNRYGFLHKAYKKNPTTAIPYMKRISLHFQNSNEFEYILLQKCYNNKQLKHSFDIWIDVLRQDNLIVNKEALTITQDIPDNMIVKTRLTKRTTKMDYKIKGTFIKHGTFTLKFN